MACLTRMAAVAATHDADITAVATSATREAENRQVFIDRVLAETGIKVEVISGIEEARLIHLGVLQALPVYDRRLLLVDIGGGSTEFLIGQGSEVRPGARSMKLGAIRLTERFFADGEAKPGRVRRCSAHVAATLTSVAAEMQEERHEVAIGSSGTIGAIASMIAAERGEEVGDLNGFRFTADELSDLVSTVDRHRARTSVRRLPGLDSRRADIIVGGALLLEGIFDAFDIEDHDRVDLRPPRGGPVRPAGRRPVTARPVASPTCGGPTPSAWPSSSIPTRPMPRPRPAWPSASSTRPSTSTGSVPRPGSCWNWRPSSTTSACSSPTPPTTSTPTTWSGTPSS